MNLEVDDPMVLLSQFYPVGTISQFVPEQAAVAAGSKRQRRRRKNKGNGGGDLQGVAMMRKRKLTEEQFNMLEKSFGMEHNLDSGRKDKLAAELGLDPQQVAVWFQNRRARWKSKKMEEEYCKLRSDHENTVVEKRGLEIELVKLKQQLHEAEKEIQRLSELWDGFTSDSLIGSSLSMNTNFPDQLFLGEFGMEGLENSFYMPETGNYAHDFEWGKLYYI